MAFPLNRRQLLKTGLASAGLGMAGAPLVQAGEPLKVGFVYPNPIANIGWSFRHEIGRQDVISEFGDQVETTFVEKVPEGADSARVINQLALTGHKMIFTASFGYMDPTIDAAKKFPDVLFDHCGGFKTAPNVGTYDLRYYEGRAVSGYIAGQMTKTGTLGYLAAFPIPHVFRAINAFTLGAQKARPDVKVKVIWAYSWYDPGLESDAAAAFINQGVDMIGQHTTSPAPCQIAEQEGIHCFGTDADMSSLAPQAHLTATVNNWGPYYIERIRAAMNGTWESKKSWVGMSEDAIQMAPYSSRIPADVASKAKNFENAIRDGSADPFDGPIIRRDGTKVAGEGERLGGDDLYLMNWFVKGVEGEVPA